MRTRINNSTVSIKRIIAPIIVLIAISACNSNYKKTDEIEQAKKYYFNAKYDSSIYYLNNIIEVDPNNAEAFFYLSRATYKINNFNMSLIYLNKADSLMFSVDSVEELKIDLFLKMVKYDDVINICDKQISKNPSNYQAYFNKAIALFNKSIAEPDTQASQEYLKLALQNINFSSNFKKNDNEYFVLRGAILYLLDDIKGATSDIEIALLREKRDSFVISQAYRWRGLIAEYQNNLESAEHFLDSAIEYANYREVLYIDRGNIKSELNKKDEACNDYRNALRLGDTSAVSKIKINCN